MDPHRPGREFEPFSEAALRRLLFGVFAGVGATAGVLAAMGAAIVIF